MSRQTQASDEAHSIKPLPPLPHGWARVTHETDLFLRGISLGIMVSAFQIFFFKIEGCHTSKPGDRVASSAYPCGASDYCRF